MFSWDDLVDEARRASQPAPAIRALSLLQWAIDSDWGASTLAREFGNFAGLRFDSRLADIAVPVLCDAGEGQALYCAFETPRDFTVAFWRLADISRVVSAEQADLGPQSIVEFLRAQGRTVESDYASKLAAILPSTARMIFNGQSAASAAPPERERISRAGSGEWIGDHLPSASTPNFKFLPTVSHRFRGIRRNGLCGAILRFDDGRTRPHGRIDSEEWGAANTLAWGQRQKLAFISVARNGTILLPGNFDWQLWGFHAGKARAPTGLSDLSEHTIGIEINGPAQLFPTADADCFVPWYNAARDSNGNVRLNVYGEARCLSRSDEWYSRDQIAIVPEQRDTLRPGVYAPVPPAQFQSLSRLLIWIKRTYPETFQFDNVFSMNELLKPTKDKPEPGFGFVTADRQLIPPVGMTEFRRVLTRRWSNQLALMAKSYFHATRTE